MECIMDFETSAMEFDIKDEAKYETIQNIRKHDQEPIEIANSETESEERINAQNLLCPSSPSSFPLENNTVHITDNEFDGNIQKRLRNSISKALVLICPNCPKTFPTSKALAKHTLKQHAAAEAEHEKREQPIFSCVTCAARNFIDQNSLDEHLKQYHVTNTVTVSLSKPRLVSVFEIDPLKIHPLTTTTTVTAPSVGTKTKLKVPHMVKTHDKPCGPESLLKCPHCDKHFSQKRFLICHISRVHIKSRPRVKCLQCPLTFSRKQTLQAHIRKLHEQEKNCDSHDREGITVPQPPPQINCPHCDKIFSQKLLLTRHIERMHSGPRIRINCPQCHLTFMDNSSLKKHVLKHHKVHENSDSIDGECKNTDTPPPVNCPHCSKAFAERFLLTRHTQRMHSGPRTRKICPHCDKTFADNCALKIHVLKFHNEHKNSGSSGRVILEVSQYNDNDADKETQKRTTNSTFNCRYCSELFCNTSSLKAHVIQIHVKQKKTFDIRNNSPARATVLVTKVGAVPDETEAATAPGKNRRQSRSQCPQCPSTFSNSRHLKFHILLQHVEKNQLQHVEKNQLQHVEKNQFPCLICESRNRGCDLGSKAVTKSAFKRGENFIFKDKYTLKQHMKNMHFCTHLKKQNCNLPEKKHKPADPLLQTQKLHKIIIPTSENKICPICSKTFSGKWSASNYRDHMRAHLGIKRYSCEHCSKKLFKTTTNLHVHLIRCHKYTSEQLNFKLQCHICNFVSRNQLQLNYHIVRQHPDSGPSNNSARSNVQLGQDPSLDPDPVHGNSKECIKNSTGSAVCFVCSRIHPSRCALIQHLKEHRGDGRFFCDLCPHDYSARLALMTHLKHNHHKLAYCNKCFTSFTDVTELNQHLLHVDASNQDSGSVPSTSANDNSPARSTSNLKCEICNESSISSCLFKIHTISHLKEMQQEEWRLADEVVSAEKIFKCPVCPTATAAFDRQSYLSAHLEIVHNSPPDPDSSSRFKCEKCDRKYKFVGELKFHDLVVHSPKINQHLNREYSGTSQIRDCNSILGLDLKCGICPADFSTHSELRNHQDQFRSEVFCHICPAKYYCESYLQKHIQKCHQEKATKGQKFLCHMCPSKFSRGLELWGHEARFHGAKSRSRYIKKKKENAT